MPDDRITRLNAALEGRYRIERQLGEGGMATVYLARDIRHNRNVALKVLKPELAAVVGADRFLAEIETTANLQHPHILPLFDSGEADSFLFYVMPFVEGESLRERLDREHQLPVAVAVLIAKNVGEALDYAHRHGVIHRDIKPANILLQDGKPVVSDFGIALALGAAGAGRLTETGLSLGTPHYMSPEQATGDLSVGAATDIYALGCVLYEMLVGEPPYTGGTPQAVLGKIIAGELAPATKQRSSVPANVDAVIRKALERVPADRFVAAKEFTDGLEDAGFRHGPGAATIAQSAGRWKQLAMALAVVALLTSGLAARALMSPSRSEAVTARFYLEGPPEGVLEGWRGLAVSPDGRTLIFGAVGTGQLYRRDVDQLDAVPIPNTANAWIPFFSPDGEWIGYYDQGVSELRKVRLDGGGAQTIAAAPGGLRSAAWSPDGSIVMWSNVWNDLRRVSDSGGVPEVIPNTEGPELRWLQMLPGGSAVLASTDDEVVAVSLDSGERKLLIPGVRPHFSATGHILFWRQGTVWAVGFDPDRLEITSDPLPVAEGVESQNNDFARFAVGGDVLFYIPGDASVFAGQGFVLVDRNGEERPLAIEIEADISRAPRLSPDGGRLLAVLGTGAELDLWVFDLERGTRSKITFGGNNSYTPVWGPTPDLVTHSDGITAPNSILLSATDGTGADTLLKLPGLQYPTSWSSNGDRLLYYENSEETGRDLWVLPVGGEPEPFLATPFQERFGEFSPDGSLLAYVSDQSGQDEVYVQPYPGPGSRVTVSTNGGREPLWSPDGSELFYRSDEALMAVRIQGGEPLRVGAPEVVFPDTIYPFGNAGVRNYDITPDGQRFVMVDPGDDNPLGARIGVVVLNLPAILAPIQD